MLRISSLPQGEQTSSLYTVALNGLAADVYPARVSAFPYNCGWPGHQRPLDQTEMSGFVSFESDEAVAVRVTPSRTFHEAIVRPISKGVSVRNENGALSFTLTEPGQYSLELDGHHENLMLFFDPIRCYPTKGENVRYYAPGIHHVGTVWLDSGETVVIERGAVVYGSFVAVDAENVRICGGGVIDGSDEKRTSSTLLLPLSRAEFGNIVKTRKGMEEYAERNHLLHGAIRLLNCRHCSIEGVTCRDSSTFTVIPANCSDLTIDGLKAYGMWRYNSDGIDLFNCQNVLVQNTFLRCFDDCMVVKGIKGWDDQNLKNIVMKHLVVWCDWGRALEIGAETCADEYSNILFEDCDIIHAAYSMCDVQNGDRAYVHDVTFRNIRCEYSRHQMPESLQTDMSVPYDPTLPVTQPRILLIQGYTGQWSKDGIAGRTERIRFENITCYADEGIEPATISFTGYAEGHDTRDITIDGITWNGKRLKREEMTFHLNEHVHGITVV